MLFTKTKDFYGRLLKTAKHVKKLDSILSRKKTKNTVLVTKFFVFVFNRYFFQKRLLVYLFVKDLVLVVL